MDEFFKAARSFTLSNFFLSILVSLQWVKTTYYKEYMIVWETINTLCEDFHVFLKHIDNFTIS
jgi:hypothetical protein